MLDPLKLTIFIDLFQKRDLGNVGIKGYVMYMISDYSTYEESRLARYDRSSNESRRREARLK